MPFSFDNRSARLPSRFAERVAPTPVARPSLLAVNAPLAESLNLTTAELTSPEGLEALAGNRIPEGAEPLALAYAGHQFGHFVPSLGDGRAILLGELVGKDGRRWDLQLKGAGPTPYSRRGDGRAALGPVLREYLVSEAMFALGVPSTRALSAVATGEYVFRETPLPGAVLARVASSHLRIGTFEYFAARQDRDALEQLTAYALERHPPSQPIDGPPALVLFDAVAERQATLVAQWMALGFVHGVMNTDNTSISGETLDYGPCAFLDTYAPERTFSSIDQHGRYAFANQPRIALWNLARLAEALLPLFDSPEDAVRLFQERLSTFPSRFDAAHADALRPKLGLYEARDGDLALAQDLLQRMAANRVDHTLCFRRLIRVVAEDDVDSVASLFPDAAALRDWVSAWRKRWAQESTSLDARVLRMQRANPAFIPRNHRVEKALAAAHQGDLQPFQRLQRMLAQPYTDAPEDAELADPPGPEQWSHQTFCGT